MSTQRRADMCTTHHHACDCREFAHAQEIEHLRAELAALRARIDECIQHTVDPMPGTGGGFGIVTTTRSLVGKRIALVPLDD